MNIILLTQNLHTRDLLNQCNSLLYVLHKGADQTHAGGIQQNIANQALFVQELKRCADEIASTDLSLQTIGERGNFSL